MKIYYKTAYDTTNTICGYVIAEEKTNHYEITKKQYDRALKNRTAGGIANMIFITDEKPLLIKGKDI